MDERTINPDDVLVIGGCPMIYCSDAMIRAEIERLQEDADPDTVTVNRRPTLTPRRVKAPRLRRRIVELVEEIARRRLEMTG
jgi:hypothetical protein